MSSGAGQNNDLRGYGDFETVYADDNLLVLNKPAGLLSVPGKGEDKQDCLSSRVQQAYPDALVVHRLDMATSGLMMMARGGGMQRSLSRLFENHEVHKRYIAMVDGDMRSDKAPDEWQLIDLPIAVDWPNRPLRVIDPLLGKPSQTRWRALSFDPATHTTRLELEPVTGRSHQLRVHLKALGHPILGDSLYATEEAKIRARRLLLHSCLLEFTDPSSGKRLSLTSEPGF
ncbi:MAG: RluA family pseudouridine synthase [Pseudomonadota bacterium]